MRTVRAPDPETRRPAKDAERDAGGAFAAGFDGESSRAGPDLLGFGRGAVVDLPTGVASRCRTGCAKALIAHPEEAAVTVGYGWDAFDLGVLPAHDAEAFAVRGRHVDLDVSVKDALDALPIDRRGAGPVRQGGLDGPARANGVRGKTGHATDVPAVLRAGREDEVLAYAAEDVRVAAELYRLARRDGKLAVDGYPKKGYERIELGRLEVRADVRAPLRDAG